MRRWCAIFIVAGSGFALVLLFLALVLAAPTLARPLVTPVRAWAVQKVADNLASQFQGSLEIGALTGSLLSAPSLADVVVRDPSGAVVVRIDAIRLRYQAASLWRGKLLVQEVDLVRPDLTLSRAADDTVNLFRLLPATAATDAAAQKGFWAPPVAVHIQRLRVQDGRGRLAFGVLDGISEISAVQMTLAGRADRTGIHLTAQEATAQANPAQVHLTGLRGAIHLAGSHLRIENLEVHTDHTRAAVDAVLPGGPHPVRLSVQLDPIDLTEVGRLLADDTLRGKARLHIQAQGALSDLRVDAHLRSAAGQVTFQGHVDMTRRPRRYRGTLQVDGLDMAALADRKGLESDLNMAVDFDAKGLSPQTLEGALNVAIQPSHVGDITLSPSRIRVMAQPHRLHVEAFELISSVAVMTAAGSLDLQGGTSDLTYQAKAHLSQLEPLLGIGLRRGSLHLEGSAKGTWPDLEARGGLIATDIQVGTGQAQGLELDYHASRLGSAPHASAQLRFHGLSVGEWRAAAGQLQATYDGDQRKVTFAAQLHQSAGMEGNLAGHLTLGDGIQHVSLDTAQFRFADRIWHAPEPLQVTLQAGAFSVQSFLLVHGDESISLAGEIARQSIRNLRLEAASLDLTFLQRQLGWRGPAAGRAALVVQVDGTFSEPLLHADLQMTPPTEQEAPFDHLRAVLRFQQKNLSTHVSARYAGHEVMRAALEAPMDLALADLSLSQRLLESPLSLSVQIRRPLLASLQPILPVPALSGTLAGDVVLRGTFANLNLVSNVELQDVGVQNGISALDAAVRLTAEIQTADSVSALAQALTVGRAELRVRRFDLLIDSASGVLPAATAGSSGQPFAIKAMRLQGNAALGSNSWQANVDQFQTTVDAFNLPPTTVSATAHLTPSQFDLRHVRIATPQSVIEGHGDMTFADRRFDLRLDVPRVHGAEFAPFLPPALARDVTGSVQLGGSTSAPTLTANLRYGEARLHLRGSADLPRSTYSAQVTLHEPDIASVVPAAHGSLNVQLALQGTGFSEADRRADLQLDFDLQDFNLAPELSGVAQVGLVDTDVVLHEFHVDSIPVQVEATGAFSQTGQLQADYQIAFKELGPLGQHLGTPLRASGGIAGSLDGTLDALRSRGEMHIENWNYGGFQGQRVRVTWQGADLTTRPRATLAASLDGIQGNALAASSLTLHGRYGDEQAQFDISVTDGPYRQTRVAGRIGLQGHQEVRLDTLQLQYRRWRWTNPGPVRLVRQSDGTVAWEDFHLEYGEQAIRANGSLQASGRLEASLALHQVEIEPWLRTFFPAVPAAGRLDLNLTAAGSLEHPEGAGVLELSELTWDDQPLGRIRLESKLADNTMASHLAWRDGSSVLLETSGVVGLVDDYPLELNVTSSSFNLARLAPLFEATRESGGWLDAALRVGGTVKAPDVRGNIVVRDGAVLLAAAGEPYHDIQARLTVAHHRLVIDELRLASTTGTAGINGWVQIAADGLERLHLTMRARDFAAMNTPFIQARLTGAVEAQGSLDAIALRGDLTIPQARIRMDGFGAGPISVSPSDLTVAGVYGGDPAPEHDIGNAAKPEPEVRATRILQTELRLSAGGNVWVVAPETAIEIRGSLLVDKNLNEPFVVAGSAETIRGFVGFMGKKFDLERGKMTFTGANEVSPHLDVVARHEVSGYTLALHLEGESRQPRFSFTSTPELTEADIASLLVFGKTLDRLSGTEEIALSGHAAKLAGDVISGLVEKQVVQIFGLDTFDVEVGDEFESGSVRGGRYVTQDLFLSYQHQLDEQGRNTVGVEYSLSPRVKLKGSSDDEGETSLDILWRIDY